MEYLTISEFGARLKVHRVTVSRWLAADRIVCVRLGRMVRIPASEVDRLLAATPVEVAS